MVSPNEAYEEIAGTRPRVRRDVLYTQTPTGAHFHNARGGFSVVMPSAYRFATLIVPHLTGDNTVEALCRGLGDKQRDLVVRLIGTLYARGFARDAVPPAPGAAQPEPAVARRFAAQIDYVDHYADDPAGRFLRFRQTRVAILGDDPVARWAALSLLRNGCAAVAVPAGIDTPANAFAEVRDEAARLRADDCPAALDVLESPAGPGEFTRADLDGFDVVLATGEQAPRQTALLLAAGLPAAVRLLPAWRFGGSMVIGPLTSAGAPGCWTCAALRLGANGDPSDAADLWSSLAPAAPTPAGPSRAVSAPLAAMIGNLLGYEVFRLTTGALRAETDGRLIVQNLDSLDTVAEPLLPHPRCPACGASGEATAVRTRPATLDGARSAPLGAGADLADPEAAGGAAAAPAGSATPAEGVAAGSGRAVSVSRGEPAAGVPAGSGPAGDLRLVSSPTEPGFGGSEAGGGIRAAAVAGGAASASEVLGADGSAGGRVSAPGTGSGDGDPVAAGVDPTGDLRVDSLADESGAVPDEAGAEEDAAQAALAEIADRDVLVQPAAGVFQRFADDTWAQTPLKVSTVALSTGHGVQREVSAFDVHHVAGARLRALYRAAEVYAEHVVPLPEPLTGGALEAARRKWASAETGRLAVSSGLGADPGPAWCAATSLLSGETVLVPAAALRPFGAHNHGRLAEPTAAGTGAGGSPRQAAARGLLSALCHHTLRRSLSGEVGAARIGLTALEEAGDAELTFLVRSAANLGVELGVLELGSTEQRPVPVALARAGDARWTAAAGLTLREAVRDAVRDLLGAVQLAHEPQAPAVIDTGDPLIRDLAPTAIRGSGNSRAELDAATTWSGLADRLRADGTDVLAAPVHAPDLAAGRLYATRILLLSGGAPHDH
ncbi:TOMM precursor leader peptide-binding protein [Streptomyces sp. CA-111067]|uniref:TOMM precursor leader peptide-binding protein n=1 Tax=Streptomyces sp. CA-111067 TaxID=3240046 RepID=UPI003D96BE78